MLSPMNRSDVSVTDVLLPSTYPKYMFTYTTEVSITYNYIYTF